MPKNHEASVLATSTWANLAPERFPQRKGPALCSKKLESLGRGIDLIIVLSTRKPVSSRSYSSSQDASRGRNTFPLSNLMD